MNNSMVAHLWAQNKKEQANGSNFFFENDTIYSYGYHFPIAKHIDKNTILFTTDNYSVTTQRHISITHNACNHKTVFEVPNINAHNKKAHRENYQDYTERIKNNCKVLTRARVRFEYHLDSINKLIESSNKYTAFFKLGYKQKPLVELDEVKTNYKKIIAKEKIVAKKKKQKELEKLFADLEDWKNGKPCNSLYRLPFNYLRIKPGNPEVLETNNHAEVPVEHAKKAWPLIKMYCENKREFKANGKVIRIGYFKIDSISKKGIMKAGCHKFEYSELKEGAKLIGLN